MPRFVLIPLDEKSHKLAKPNEIMVDYNDRQHLSTRIDNKVYSKTRDLEYMITEKIESDRVLNNAMSDSGFLYSEPVQVGELDKLQFTIPFSIVNVNGYILEIPERTITIQEGTTSLLYDNENRYADLVYLECYKVEDTIEEILPNGLPQITRIEKFKTFLRVVNHVDFINYYEGITSPLVKPINVDGNLIPTQPSYRNLPNQTDLGCYIIEDESVLTVDHKIYAIPLFKIKRRNVGTFSKTNMNHGLNSSFIIKGGSKDGGFSYTGQVITIDKASTASYTVGKNYVHYKDDTKIFKVNAVSSTSMTIENISTNGNWFVRTDDKFILDTGRPDNKSATIIYNDDIIDLRHFVSFEGYNYNQLLKDNFNKLILGSLNQYNFKTMAYETTSQVNATTLYKSLSTNSVPYINYFKKNVNNPVYIAKDDFKGKTKGSAGSLITYLNSYVTMNENIKNLTEKECAQTVYDNLQSSRTTFNKVTLATDNKMIQYNFLFTLDEILKDVYNNSSKITMSWIKNNIALKFTSYFNIANTNLYITLFNFETNKFESPYLNVIQTSGLLDLIITNIEDKYISADNTIMITVYSDNVAGGKTIEATPQHAELLFDLKSFKFGNIALPKNINVNDYRGTSTKIDIITYDDLAAGSKTKGYFSNSVMNVEIFYEKNMYQGMSQAILKRFNNKDHLYFENDKVLTNYQGYISTIPNTNTLFVSPTDTHYPYHNYKNINEILPLPSSQKSQVINATLMENSLLIDVHELAPIAINGKIFPDTKLITGELTRPSDISNSQGIPYNKVMNQDGSQFSLYNSQYKPSHVNNRLNISMSLVHCKQTNEIYLLVMSGIFKDNTFVSSNPELTYIDIFALDGRPLLKLSRKSN